MKPDLPELPRAYYEPDPHDEYAPRQDMWSADQLRAYGLECFRAGMLRGAEIAEQINTESGGGFEPFADAIREEAGNEE